MNTAILHSAHPESKKTKSRLPKQAVQFAKQMGIDLTGLTAEAEDIWSMLDDMSSNNPHQYGDFIKDQFENYKSDGDKPEGDKYFRPQAGFCVKSFTTAGDGIKVRDKSQSENTGKLIFLNICLHPAVEPPIDERGQKILHDRPTADGLQFPLLVGPLRDTEDSDGTPSFAVDVIFHPSVVDKCSKHSPFKRQLIELAIDWVQQETKVSINKKWNTLKSPSYIGGRGHEKNTPVLFSVDFAMQQAERRDGSGKDLTKSSDDPISNPQSLLNLVKDSRRSEEEISPASSEIETHKLFKKPEGNDISFLLSGEGSNDGRKRDIQLSQLIREVSELDNIPIDDHKVDCTYSPEHGRPSEAAHTVIGERSNGKPNSNGTTKPLIRKGFLKDSAGKIYPNGSSEGEGGGNGGAYTRFMEKCKIVDTSKLSADEFYLLILTDSDIPPYVQVRQAARTHATAPTPELYSPPKPAKARLNPKQKEPSPGVSAEIDKLLGALDDEYGSQQKPDLGKEWGNEFDIMSKVFSAGLKDDFLRLPLETQDTRKSTIGTESKSTQITSKFSPPKPFNKSDLTTMSVLPSIESLVNPLEYSIVNNLSTANTVDVYERAEGDRTVLDIKVGGVTTIQMKSADLQISASEIHLKLKCVEDFAQGGNDIKATSGELKIQTNFKIDCNMTCAKMSKKSSSITITVYR